jgi:hypothetical protein
VVVERSPCSKIILASARPAIDRAGRERGAGRPGGE